MNNLSRTFACTLICRMALSILRFPIAVQAEPL
jgi:hypothetical protein